MKIESKSNREIGFLGFGIQLETSEETVPNQKDLLEWNGLVMEGSVLNILFGFFCYVEIPNQSGQLINQIPNS